MKRRITTFVAAVTMLLSAGTAFAQEGEDKVLEKIKDFYSRLSIGAKVYFDWYGVWGHDSSSFDRVANGERGSDASAKNNNSFRIQRAYVDLKYKINDILHMRVTSDVDASVTPSSASNAAFHLYLKYAYIEAKKDFGPVWISATGGMIETPVIGLTDKISDYRWIQQNYLDQAKYVLNNTSLDNSADIGVKASFGFSKYVTLTGAFTNGEGYKSNESVGYKAVTYLVTVNPIKELYISGFGRNEITAKYDYTGKKAKREYYGYGVAYSSDLIKVGFNHIFPYVTTVGVASYFDSTLKLGSSDVYVYPVKKTGYMLLDSWLNFNLGAVVPSAPLLVTGRFVYGLQRGTYQKLYTDKECGKTRSTMLYAIGLGWQFNKNFRILVGGELQKYFVKKDQMLRYVESTSSGTDYYNGTALGIGNVYVSSHQPHDSKRVYVKTEFTF